MLSLVIVALLVQQPESIEVTAERLRKMGDLLKQPETMQRELEPHLSRLKMMKAMRADLTDLKKTHGTAMQKSGGGGPFAKLDTAWRYADIQLREYERYAGMVATPAAVKEQLDSARRLAKLAVENQAPAFFKADNSLAKHLVRAKECLLAFEAVEPQSPQLTTLREEIATTEKEMARIASTMQAAILKGNEPPADSYQQSDRAVILEQVKALWEKQKNAPAPLAMGINSHGWRRDIYWQRVGSTWHLSDLSKLQAFVIVPLDGTRAAVHYVNITRDHLAQDRLAVSWLQEPGSEVALVNQVLRTRVK
ncbi:MAG: hypothetical protein U0796_00480 [Gemmatales bacterium]